MKFDPAIALQNSMNLSPYDGVNPVFGRTGPWYKAYLAEDRILSERDEADMICTGFLT